MKVGLGQDSHRFEKVHTKKKLVLGGTIIQDHVALDGNSDADVVYHAITNAISSVTGVNILGRIADEMCKSGITDSKAYIKEAMKYMNQMTIHHVAISIECKTPKLAGVIPFMKESIASVLNISKTSVGITATSGEDLTPFGQGLGIQALCIITVEGNG
ncbi:MAG TPA: 2-C-methyl-D-erythritol 2,4-cyclodiphosphate synthase [Clostridiales bacterium]|nr:2-C-methyl-D-erythritol 2,4-cyclodiphosphate synthase [Clostridiales bacterium]